MIVKIQIPLNNQRGPFFIYDEGRTIALSLPQSDQTDHIIEALADDVRGYFEAELVNMQIIVGRRVDEQDW
jgi:hypothetical protein